MAAEQKEQVEQQLEMVSRSKTDLETVHAAAQSNIQISSDNIDKLKNSLEEHAGVSRH